MVETLIHIGQPKTGTTAIQAFLAENREVLINHGVYVPDQVAGFKDRSHFALSVWAIDRDRRSPKKDELGLSRGELDQGLRNSLSFHYHKAKDLNCKFMLWTNEGLYFLNSTQEYQRLVNLSRRFSTKTTAICCFRDKASFLQSWVRQLGRMGVNPSDDIDSYRHVKQNSWLLDYDRKRRLLSESFDEVVSFEYDPEDNVTRFIELVLAGLQPVGLRSLENRYD